MRGKGRRPSIQSQYFGRIMKLLYKKGFVCWVDVANELGVSAPTANRLLRMFVKNDYVRKRLAEQNLKVVYASAIQLGFDKLDEGARKYAFLCWKDTGVPLIAPVYSAWRVADAQRVKEQYLREQETIRGLDRWLRFGDSLGIGSGGPSPRTPHRGERSEGG